MTSIQLEAVNTLYTVFMAVANIIAGHILHSGTGRQRWKQQATRTWFGARERDAASRRPPFHSPCCRKSTSFKASGLQSKPTERQRTHVVASEARELRSNKRLHHQNNEKRPSWRSEGLFAAELRAAQPEWRPCSARGSSLTRQNEIWKSLSYCLHGGFGSLLCVWCLLTIASGWGEIIISFIRGWMAAMRRISSPLWRWWRRDRLAFYVPIMAFQRGTFLVCHRLTARWLRCCQRYLGDGRRVDPGLILCSVSAL